LTRQAAVLEATPPQRCSRRAAEPGPSAPRRPGLTRYLTDGIELYRLLGAVTDGVSALVGVEDCRSLQIMLIPISELGTRFHAVLPSNPADGPNQAGMLA